jgi:hypothetical protein
METPFSTARFYARLPRNAGLNCESGRTKISHVYAPLLSSFRLINRRRS